VPSDHLDFCAVEICLLTYLIKCSAAVRNYRTRCSLLLLATEILRFLTTRLFFR